MDLFQNPWMLAWMLLILPAMAALHSWSESSRKNLLAVFGRPASVSRLFPESASARRRQKAWLELSTVGLLLLALAAPQWGVELVAQVARGTQVLVAVDTSLSMFTEDVKPSRIAKAKRELTQLLDGLKGNRIGILAFAGSAMVQCPLTTDMEAVGGFLGSLQVGMIPQPGTAIGEALDLGTQMLSKYPGHKAIVILSDGEDHVGHMLDSARRAAAAGIHVYMVGIGTPEGAPIPLRDDRGDITSYKKDSTGRTVISKLEESGLIQLAAASEGAYYRSTPEETEAFEIARRIAGLEKSGGQSGSLSRYKNRYRLPLLLAFLILLIEWFIPESGPLLPEMPPRPLSYAAPGVPIRSSIVSPGTAGSGTGPAAFMALLIFVSFSASGCGSGQSNLGLWRGNKSFSREQFPEALERYVKAAANNPKSPKPVFNIGDAQYKLGNMEGAEKAFSAIADPKKVTPLLASQAFYNRGNVHFRKNELKEAVEDYKRCLILNPEDEDCRFNLVRTLQQLKQPSQKQKQNQKNQDRKNQRNDQNRQDKNDQKNPSKERPQSGMTQEDAQRVLQAVEEKEKSAPNLRQPQNRKPSESASGDDW